MTIHRPLIEQKLRSYQPLRHLPLMPARCRARLRWCLARSACQTLPWPARSPDLSSIKHVWDVMGRRLPLQGNVDDLAQ
ncbi:hypothetical protein TNCV_2206901 [Trichonephila clavipes]|uniref:Uncharacterized protein n=1 Tax=Trichonephila clavipes TaxID=2585209 RepID=A0A8X6VF91_TRICX|nr:hypothetical protein TNCV_2206901 [Trichonephila clavipes]